ncbi:MAG: tetratricopeptide repeat protein [Bacilli bacterium]|nr:tetratricopeptide repeat protein [Bacilli bacterium]
MGKGNSIKKRQNKLNQIRNLIEEANYKRALYEIVNYVKTYPDDVLGHYLYGKLLLRKNELQEARKQFQLVLEFQDENEVKALMNLATIARKEGDPEEAIKYYKKVIEDSEYTDIYAVNVLAHLYRYEKRSLEAIELINKCTLNPELAKELAKNLSIVGRRQEAFALLEEFPPETRKEERDMSLNKGRIAAANDEYDKAMFYYEDAKDGDEKDSIYYKAIYEEIKLLIAYDKYQEAIKYCEELLSIDNHFNGEINLLMGIAKQATKKYQEAYENYLLSTERATDRDIRAQGYYYAGSLDFARGRLSYAETNFKRSISNARETSEITYTKLIGVLLRQEKYGEVLKYVSRLKKHIPQNWKDSPVEYVEMIVNKRLGKKMPPRDSCSYTERQIIKYKEKDAIAHIEQHHKGASKTRGNFAKDINIEVLYYDVRSMLTEDNLVNEDAMDIYEIEYRNAGYDLENNLVHHIRAVVFPSTKNILTMYPGHRATVPKKCEFRTEKSKTKKKSPQN